MHVLLEQKRTAATLGMFDISGDGVTLTNQEFRDEFAELEGDLADMTHLAEISYVQQGGAPDIACVKFTGRGRTHMICIHSGHVQVHMLDMKLLFGEEWYKEVTLTVEKAPDTLGNDPIGVFMAFCQLEKLNISRMIQMVGRRAGGRGERGNDVSDC